MEFHWGVEGGRSANPHCSWRKRRCLGAFRTCHDCHDADNDHISKKLSLIDMRPQIRQLGKVLQDAFNIKLGFLPVGHRGHSNHDFKDITSTKPKWRKSLDRAGPNYLKCASAPRFDTAPRGLAVMSDSTANSNRRAFSFCGRALSHSASQHAPTIKFCEWHAPLRISPAATR